LGGRRSCHRPLIERKAGEQGEFKRVAELKPWSSAKEVQKGIEKAASVLPIPLIWRAARRQHLGAYPTPRYTEQLGAAKQRGGVLAVNAVWHDGDVKAGTKPLPASPHKATATSSCQRS
jgi:hypothetical protein